MFVSLHLESGGPLHDRAGDERGPTFDALYARWYEPLVSYCSRHVWGTEDAEAVAQDAFLRAWLSWEKYSPDRPFWPWVVTIARRLCINRTRAYELSRSLVGTAPVESSEPNPEDAFELAEQSELARRAWQRLKPRDQRVLRFREIEGWSYEEIARLEEVSVESVRGSLKRARAALRATYCRLAKGVLGVGGWLRCLRDRAFRELARVQGLGATAGAVAHLGDTVAALVGIVAISIVPAAAAAPAVPGPTPVAPASSIAQDMGPRAIAVAVAAEALSQEPASTGGTLRRDDEYAPSSPTEGEADLFGDRMTSPEDARFDQFTPSPHYEQDGTVFAVGQGAKGCVRPCPVLFRSSDRGATWQRLRAEQFGGGSLHLARGFPADQRMFASGPRGLQVSDNGGATFRTVSPLQGPLAVSPLFGTDDDRVLIGAAPGWEYRADLGTTTPFTATEAMRTVSDGFTMAFSDRYRDDRTLFVGGTQAMGIAWSSTVTRCTAGACAPATVLPGSTGVPPKLFLHGPETRSAALVAWKFNAVFRSEDQGRTFFPSAVPVDGMIHAVFPGPQGELYLLGSRAGQLATALYRSDDDGTTWDFVADGAQFGSPATAVALSDGRLIMAPRVFGSGVLCSTDRGLSWQRRCRM